MTTNGVVRALAPATVDELGVPVKRGDEQRVARVLPHFAGLEGPGAGTDVTGRFRELQDRTV